MAEKIAELEAKYEEGREHGIAQAQTTIESESLAALNSIRDTMFMVTQSLNNELARIEADSIKMAATLARLYADALIDRDPIPMITDAIRKCTAMANDTPNLTITISTHSPDGLRDAISNAAIEAGYRGQVIIRTDERLRPGDIRVDWPEGGFLRDRARIDAVIKTIFEIEFGKSLLDEDSHDESN